MTILTVMLYCFLLKFKMCFNYLHCMLHSDDMTQIIKFTVNGDKSLPGLYQNVQLPVSEARIFQINNVNRLGCWSPGSLLCQVISSHGIDYAG